MSSFSVVSFSMSTTWAGFIPVRRRQAIRRPEKASAVCCEG